MAYNLFTKDKHSQQFLIALIGFLTVMTIIFSFQYLATFSKGIKNNYNNIFCSHNN